MTDEFAFEPYEAKLEFKPHLQLMKMTDFATLKMA